MFGNSHFDRVAQIFADQFASDAHGHVYRKSQKGAQFRVSAAERDTLIATFRRRMRYSIWSASAATIILTLIVASFTFDSGRSEGGVAILIGLAAIFAPVLAFFYWSWNAPVRALQGRTPESPALTKREAHALSFSKITYGQLCLAAAMGVGLIWKQSLERDGFIGWGKVWLVMGGGLVLLSAGQMLRKWRFGQPKGDE